VSRGIKPVVWIGSSRTDLASFPEDVKDAIGYALYIAQRGGKHGDAKPLRGFGGAGILEVGRYLSRRVYGPTSGSHLCFACVPEEVKGRSKRIEVEEGRGNVFADIGLPNPEERLAKADLAIRIAETIRTRRLTQTRAAHLLKIDQPKISRLLRGQLSGFSTERLLHFLTLLGRDVEITIKPVPRSRRQGHLRVVATA